MSDYSTTGFVFWGSCRVRIRWRDGLWQAVCESFDYDEDDVPIGVHWKGPERDHPLLARDDAQEHIHHTSLSGLCGDCDPCLTSLRVNA